MAHLIHSFLYSQKKKKKKKLCTGQTAESSNCLKPVFFAARISIHTWSSALCIYVDKQQDLF